MVLAALAQKVRFQDECLSSERDSSFGAWSMGRGSRWNNVILPLQRHGLKGPRAGTILDGACRLTCGGFNFMSSER
jgi:hypothetical protein